MSRFLKVLEVAATAVTRFLKLSAEETVEDVSCRARRRRRKMYEFRGAAGKN